MPRYTVFVEQTVIYQCEVEATGEDDAYDVFMDGDHTDLESVKLCDERILSATLKSIDKEF